MWAGPSWSSHSGRARTSRASGQDSDGYLRAQAPMSRTSAAPPPKSWPPRRRSAGTPPRSYGCCSPRRSPAGTVPRWPPAGPGGVPATGPPGLRRVACSVGWDWAGGTRVARVASRRLSRCVGSASPAMARSRSDWLKIRAANAAAVPVTVTSAGARSLLGRHPPPVTVAVDQVVVAVEAEVPVGRLVVACGIVDGLHGGAQQVLGMHRLTGLGLAPGVA